MDTMLRTGATVVLLLCLLLLVSGKQMRVLIDRSGDAWSDEQFVQAELFPKEPPGSSALLNEWSHYILGVSGLLSVRESLRDPNAHNPIPAPDQRSDPPGYHWQRIGKVSPNELTPLTEGYRPPLHGYFQQSAECDQFMRMWADQCAFKEAGENVYHAGPKTFFEPGQDSERKSSSTYLKEVLEKWESQSSMALSAVRFGGQPKGAEEEPPMGLDPQAAPQGTPGLDDAGLDGAGLDPQAAPEGEGAPGLDPQAESQGPPEELDQQAAMEGPPN